MNSVSFWYSTCLPQILPWCISHASTSFGPPHPRDSRRKIRICGSRPSRQLPSPVWFAHDPSRRRRPGSSRWFGLAGCSQRWGCASPRPRVSLGYRAADDPCQRRRPPATAQWCYWTGDPSRCAPPVEQSDRISVVKNNKLLCIFNMMIERADSNISCSAIPQILYKLSDFYYQQWICISTCWTIKPH